MKIMKHSQESSNANGLLVGIDLDGTMHVTNSFAMPNLSDDDDKSGKTAGKSFAMNQRLGFNKMAFIRPNSKCEISSGNA